MSPQARQMVPPQQIKENFTALCFFHRWPCKWLGVHSSWGPSNDLWHWGSGSWQEGDRQPQAATQPASLPRLSALTPPHRRTAAPGDPGWAGRRCKCSAPRTFSASAWKTRWERIQDRGGAKSHQSQRLPNNERRSEIRGLCRRPEDEPWSPCRMNSFV